MCKHHQSPRPVPHASLPHWFDYDQHWRRQRERYLARQTRGSRRRRRRGGRAARGPYRLALLAALLLAGPAIMFAAGFVLRVARTLLSALAGAADELLHGVLSLLSVRWVPVLILALVARKLWRRSQRRRVAPASQLDAPVAPPAAAAAPAPGMTTPGRLELTTAAAQRLRAERRQLPAAVSSALDSLLRHLDALTLQLEQPGSCTGVDAGLERLLGDELPQLLSAYLQVPQTLRVRRLHGGSTPEQQLLSGLVTIDEQLVRLHEALAADALKALATHQRFLDLKYGRGLG